MENETITCKECGKELSASKFKVTRWGSRAKVCNQCVSDKLMATTKFLKEQKSQERIATLDPDFDGKQPVEVIQLMSRAKKWLEARGYEITLKGEYKITKQIRF